MQPVERRILLLLALAVAVVFYRFDLDRPGPTLCLYARLTGTACPFCGFTRSLWLGLHGRPAEAVRLHPLGWLTAVAFPFVCLWLAAPGGIFAGFRGWRRPVLVGAVLAFGSIALWRVLLTVKNFLT